MITLNATWKHHGPVEPYRVQAEALDEAETILIGMGYLVDGTASGYAVQENESDVSITVHTSKVVPPVPRPEALAARLAEVTGKPWTAADQ